ncbi:MAG: DUF2461 domain-containing protein [Candidatus Eisenbacteria bacterium]
MSRRSAARFHGFSPEALDFLENVRARDSKAWFEENRERYRELLVEPFQALVLDLTPAMRRIDPRFELRPAVGRAISRIYRDTRFSKDKSLFRDSMWIAFKRPSKEWTGEPSYFFEITPSFYRYGMGYYSASRATMDELRARIDENPAAFRRAIAFRKKGSPFDLRGETYKRRLPSRHAEEIQDWTQRKSFYLVADRPIDKTLFSPRLARLLDGGFRALGPLYRYLSALR